MTKIFSKFLIIFLCLNVILTSLYPALLVTVVYGYEEGGEDDPYVEPETEDSQPVEEALDYSTTGDDAWQNYLVDIPQAYTQPAEVSQDPTLDSAPEPSPDENSEPLSIPEPVITYEDQQNQLADYSQAEDDIWARKQAAWAEKREQAAEEVQQSQQIQQSLQTEDVAQTLIGTTDDVFDKSEDLLARTGGGLSDMYANVYETIVLRQEQAAEVSNQQLLMAGIEEMSRSTQRSEEEYKKDLEAALNAPEEEKVQAMRDALNLPEGGFDDDQVQNIFKEAAKGAGLEIEGDPSNFTLTIERPKFLSDSAMPEISATQALQIVNDSPCSSKPKGAEMEECIEQLNKDIDTAFSAVVTASGVTLAVVTAPVWIPVAAAGATALTSTISGAGLSTYVTTTSAGMVVLSNSPRIIQAGTGFLAQHGDVIIPAATWAVCQGTENPSACIQENFGPVPQITELASGVKTLTKFATQTEKNLDFAANTAIDLATGGLKVVDSGVAQQGTKKAIQKPFWEGVTDTVGGWFRRGGAEVAEEGLGLTNQAVDGTTVTLPSLEDFSAQVVSQARNTAQDILGREATERELATFAQLLNEGVAPNQIAKYSKNADELLPALSETGGVYDAFNQSESVRQTWTTLRHNGDIANSIEGNSGKAAIQGFDDLSQDDLRLDIIRAQATQAKNFKEKLEPQIKDTQDVLSQLIDEAVAGGANRSKFQHEENLFDPEKYYISNNLGEGNLATTEKATGSVLISEEVVGDFATFAHDCTHRACGINKNAQGALDYYDQLNSDLKDQYDNLASQLDQLDIFAPEREAIEKQMREAREALAASNQYLNGRKLEEGLTEWLVRKADGTVTSSGKVISVPAAEVSYKEHVQAIDELIEKAVSSGVSRQQAESAAIEAALTGDAKRLIEYAGGPQVAREALDPLIDPRQWVRDVPQVNTQIDNIATDLAETAGQKTASQILEQGKPAFAGTEDLEVDCSVCSITGFLENVIRGGRGSAEIKSVVPNTSNSGYADLSNIGNMIKFSDNPNTQIVLSNGEKLTVSPQAMDLGGRTIVTVVDEKGNASMYYLSTSEGSFKQFTGVTKDDGWFVKPTEGKTEANIPMEVDLALKQMLSDQNVQIKITDSNKVKSLLDNAGFVYEGSSRSYYDDIAQNRSNFAAQAMENRLSYMHMEQATAVDKQVINNLSFDQPANPILSSDRKRIDVPFFGSECGSSISCNVSIFIDPGVAPRPDAPVSFTFSRVGEPNMILTDVPRISRTNRGISLEGGYEGVRDHFLDSPIGRELERITDNYTVKPTNTEIQNFMAFVQSKSSRPVVSNTILKLGEKGKWEEWSTKTGGFSEITVGATSLGVVAGTFLVGKTILQDNFNSLENLTSVKHILANEGEINSDEVKQAIKDNSTIRPEGIREGDQTIVVTGGDGQVKFEIDHGVYSVNVLPVKDVNITTPQFVDIKNGSEFISIGINQGNGDIKKIDSEVKAAGSAIGGTSNVQVVTFYDRNSNGKLDSGETVVPWAGVVVTVTKVNQQTNISLNQGWNLVTLDALPSKPITASVLLAEIAKQGGYATTVSALENGFWKSYVIRGSNTYSGEDFAIEPGKAYFVKAEEKSNFAFEGQNFVAPVKLNLASGWNAVGIPYTDQSYKASNLIDAFNNNKLQSDVAARWESGLWDTLVKKQTEEYGENFAIAKNRGYLVRLEQGGEFTP